MPSRVWGEIIRFFGYILLHTKHIECLLELWSAKVNMNILVLLFCITGTIVTGHDFCYLVSRYSQAIVEGFHMPVTINGSSLEVGFE